MDKSIELCKLLFRSKMTLNHDTIQTLAADLDISRQTCGKKIDTISGWTNDEIAKIAKRYNLTDDEIITMFNLRALFGDPQMDHQPVLLRD